MKWLVARVFPYFWACLNIPSLFSGNYLTLCLVFQIEGNRLKHFGLVLLFISKISSLVVTSNTKIVLNWLLFNGIKGLAILRSSLKIKTRCNVLQCFIKYNTFSHTVLALTYDVLGKEIHSVIQGKSCWAAERGRTVRRERKTRKKTKKGKRRKRNKHFVFNCLWKGCFGL